MFSRCVTRVLRSPTVARSFSTPLRNAGRTSTRTVLNKARWMSTGAATLGLSGGLVLLLNAASADGPSSKAQQNKVDYNDVRKSISELLDDNDYDDGSYGPLFVRLGWHASGTYSMFDKTGGSNGGCIRFEPESGWGANKGLHIARQRLEKVHQDHPGLSYADLYTLAAVVAIEEMGGPKIKWSPGRVDHLDGKRSPADGRLPDAAQGAQHIREIFHRMGFNDQEIVALCGAHSLGRCHTDRSGFQGPWTFAPTTFSNEYFRLLLEESWQVRQWNGPKQYEDYATKKLMMLPADIALVQDPEFKKYVVLYAKDGEKFSADFAAAFSKLLSLGVDSKSSKASPWPFWKKLFG